MNQKIQGYAVGSLFPVTTDALRGKGEGCSCGLVWLSVEGVDTRRFNRLPDHGVQRLGWLGGIHQLEKFVQRKLA